MQIQQRSFLKKASTCLAALASLAGVSASAVTLEITVENLSEEGGIWFTPVFLGFHNGSYDAFDEGERASEAIENLAEIGDPSGLVGEIYPEKSAVLTRDGSGSPPGALFAPGTSNSLRIDLDPFQNRYLSFASMLLPSNDAFFGNDDQRGYALFNADGSFNSGLVIDIFGYDIWDAGTELNDGLGTPTFNPTAMATDTFSPIARHEGLDNFLGTASTPGGGQLDSAFSDDTLLARISVKQVPDSAQGAALMGALALIGFRIASKRRFSKRKS